MALEDQQTHIRTGLDKLHQTEAQVTELRYVVNVINFDTLIV